MASDRWHCVAQAATGERDIERRFRPFQGEKPTILGGLFAGLISKIG
jgi:hypothetical protein